MSSDPPAPPHNPLWHTAKEYLTHWFVAGVIVTLTGFTPDHWVAHVFHVVNLDSLRGAFVEYQFLAIYIGVTFLILDVVVRNRGRRFEPVAATPALADASGFVAATRCLQTAGRNKVLRNWTNLYGCRPKTRIWVSPMRIIRAVIWRWMIFSRRNNTPANRLGFCPAFCQDT